MRQATTPFLLLSVVLVVGWSASKFSVFLTPPREQHLAVRLILLWSFYPGALIWAALFRWCARHADAWGQRRAVLRFWLAALAPAPIPLLIHWALIAHDRAAGLGLYAHLGDDTWFIFVLPIVSVALSSLVTLGLAHAIQRP